MSDAPERIWATGDNFNGSWTSREIPPKWGAGTVEYVRADIVQTLTAEREAFEQDNHRWKMECENFWRDRERILTAERDRLREALRPILRFVPQYIVECRGDKCREPWCASCCGEDAANAAVERAQTEAADAQAALKGESHE